MHTGCIDAYKTRKTREEKDFCEVLVRRCRVGRVFFVRAPLRPYNGSFTEFSRSVIRFRGEVLSKRCADAFREELHTALGLYSGSAHHRSSRHLRKLARPW